MPASEIKAAEAKKLPGIFISYRRSDNPDAVGRIYDRLVSEFGKARVFKDVDSIPLGQDFRGHLNDIVGGCAAVLAIIGPKWIDTRNGTGQRRLEDPDDFVRIELEAALARNIPVVPVLVGHAPMPGTTDLPSTLASMAYRQSIEVRPDPDFHHDATRLVAALRQILDPNAPAVDATPGLLAVPVNAPPATARKGRSLNWMIAFATAALVAVALAIPALRHLRETPLSETRLEIVTSATDQPQDFALSPDGRQLVFVAKGDGTSRLWLRPLSTVTAQPLPGTEGAIGPFWSPDSRSIGFFVLGAVKRLDLGAGQPQVLTATVSFGRAGTWNPDGVILVSGLGQELMRIPASGGAAVQVIKSDANDLLGALPLFLPDGRRFLFVSDRTATPGVYLASLDGSTPVRLTSEGDRVAYLPSGWMLWLRAGTLVAQRLDIDKAALVGVPMTLADGVFAMSTSTTGLVAYRANAAGQLQLTWVDRSGRILGTVGEPDGTISSPRVAPDGRRVAMFRETQGNLDVWVMDGARTSRVTFDAKPDLFPAWSSDGTRLAFLSGPTSAARALHQKLASGVGAEEPLVVSDLINYPTSWSADGRFLMYFGVKTGDKVASDIWVLPMTGDRKPFPFIDTPALEVWGQFSPDGRWVAYQSDESGRNEVYVRPFVPPGEAGGRLETSSGQWQVSTSGGVHPQWRPDGKELNFIDPAGRMMAASIAVAGSAVVPGIPEVLFQANVPGGGSDRAQGRQYDVAPDGRFLVNMQLSGAVPPITLIQNWNPDAGK